MKESRIRCQVDECNQEYARTPEIEAIFGLKSGTLRNLEASGHVRSVALKVTGIRSKLKLWDIRSIREFLRAQEVKA
jgi:hypothetical protein